MLESTVTMTMTLREQAWQSGLVLLDETPEWNENDWPPLQGGWRYRPATVVLDHPDQHNNINNKRQTVVVMGGNTQDLVLTSSVLVMNLEGQNKQWREGPPMNKSRRTHAAVVCNGAVYVMGGHNQGPLDSIERIDAMDVLQSSSTSSSTRASNWTTLKCRLSTRRYGCCAVAVHNRYIIVVGGCNWRDLSSVEIIDTNNQIVTAGPSMTVPRAWCATAVIGRRIFVVGGWNLSGDLDSVEYLDLERPWDDEEIKKETGSTFISFSSTWITHSDLVLSIARSSCEVVAVGSCLVVAGGRGNATVEVFDTHHNRMWNLPSFVNHRNGFTMVTVANQVAMIGGGFNPTCATLPLLDKHTWCFRQLFKQQPDRWCLFREGMNTQHSDISPFPTWTSARKRARPNTRRGDEGKDGT